MKKILIYSFTALFLMSGCRKSDNPAIPELARVPLPQLKVDPTLDQVISAQTPDAFSGKITIALYYPDDTKPQKMDLVVIKNGDKSNVKTVTADITTYPTTVPITGALIKSLFGVSSKLGDSYDFGMDITTQDGKFFPAFPLNSAGVNSGVTSIANSTPTVRIAAICKFKMEDYGAIGSDVNYTVVLDEWADYSEGQTIPVHIIDATHLSFEYGTNDAKPIIIAINPDNNSTSVAKQVYGNYGTPPAWPYGDISAESVANNAANMVAPCELTVGVRLSHTVAAGSFGQATIILKKK